MAPAHLLDIPRPKTFLHTMSLRTGAEIITFLQIINKVSGLYGMLALLTGAHLSPLQFSMYLYSIIVLVTTVFLYSHVRKQSPFQCLVLAHVYALDSVVNALYTAFFGVAWFMVLAHNDSKAGQATGISQNAGFTSPQYNVSSVNIVAEPAGGLKTGQDAVAIGQGKTGSDDQPGLGSAVFQSSSIMSISLIAGFWALRVYFVFIMLSFSRQCLRQYIATHGSSSAWYSTDSTPALSSNLAENPFKEGKEFGYGWIGKLGRIMLSGAPEYWLGADEDREWMRTLGGKFRQNAEEPVGVNERERRRRSGTGPPAPPRDLPNPRLAQLPEVR